VKSIKKNIATIELVVFGLFFLILFILKGPGIYPDSQTYIIMQSGREPVYPVFLALLRAVFGWLPGIRGIDGYLWVACFLQGLMAFASCIAITRTIRRHFELSEGWEGLVALCTLLPYVMTPVASISHMILQNSILTEGICFPVYAIFQCALVDALFEQDMDRKIKLYLGTSVICFLLVLIRNQMLVALAIWGFVVICDYIRHKKPVGILVLMLGVVIFFGGKWLGYKAYNQAVDTGFSGANSGSYNLLTTLMYLSDEEDINLLSDEYDRTLFERMYGRIAENGLGHANAPEGILDRAYHFEDSYDVIGFDIQQEVLFNAATRHAGEDSRTTYVMEKADVFVKALFPAMIPRFIGNYLVTVVSGLERSVSMKGEILSIYAWILWAVGIVLFIWLLFGDGIKEGIQTRETWLLGMAIISILINTGAISLLIMCLSRYMVYNTALFYIAVVLAIRKQLDRRN